ncbi:zinc-dependent alcohol dehydrogenase family protein [Agrobacterium rhizogenes]|uniref:zinc-dependent alcohol dehydrogenase family protein n=1 Tax=Rhizobium rhizogenes TaxID=359 RepID=UPI0015719982|nr:zinc-binding dehydrogenase [Rhizobium rhizogenes]NTH16719.1 zinc-dependent alcohol dehydrogenase family protein [Rhizobium rhizogenes]
MTKAARFHRLGGPDVLQIEDIPVGEPGVGEILVAVETIGLNRGESLFREGKYAVQPILPCLVGAEGSGVIEALGEGVSGFAEGDRINVLPTFRPGAYGLCAERAIIPVASVVPALKGISPIAAAAVWVAYSTAYALVELANIGPGDFVIVPAASSSVGIAAIQIALSVGATPIATTRRNDKIAALRSLGATHVIATEESDLVAEVLRITDGKGARVAFDPVAGPYVNTLANAMADEGIILIYGDLSGQPTPYPTWLAAGKGLSMRGFVAPNHIWGRPDRFARTRAFIEHGLANGTLKPIVARTFPLELVAEAHRYLESNAQVGKVVITV